ncbi:putative boron transporter 7 [Citrus sinensis]|uniref:Boron transporter 7 n=1 Tax=Citrus sinensis TaxID=2711 RepID=A0ACB8NNA2_CITSI|nr:putative boron transporter 7 [Citrus sinensis]KAH9799236.1 putative boron transporter 7 [Citrus sinensis]
MSQAKTPFQGMIKDFKVRAACYKQDWIGIRYWISLPLALPVIAFGKQLSRDTDGILGTVETVASTVENRSYCVLIVSSLRVCVWMAILLFLLAIFNACNVINRFIRMAEELFGLLIAVLFIQEAGVVSEFRIAEAEDPKLEKCKYNFEWLYANGRQARSWRYGTGCFRSFLADYGIPLSIPGKPPSDIPRRLFCPPPWDSASLYYWTVIVMGFFIENIHCPRYVQIPILYIFAAIIPALMIAGLYFFNQCTSQMAQQKEFNLRNPSTYHYDILLLGIKQTWEKMVKSAKECIKQHESNSEIYGRMQAVFTKIDTSPTRSDLIQPSSVPKEMEDLKEFVMKADDGGDAIEKFDLKKHIDACLPVRINEQRVSNTLQSLLIPNSVLWGYFAYWAFDNVPGNQFWERLLLLFITPRRSCNPWRGVHASFVGLVPYMIIGLFTVFQLVYFLFCFGIAWTPIAGVLFPLPFFFLISIRQYILPKIFHPDHLQELNASEYEEIASILCCEILDEMTAQRGGLKFRTVG